jgi:hypothetical protein
MKNTHDPFDDELKNRLERYSEEPDDKLWSGISSNIESVQPGTPWTKWISMGTPVILAVGVLIYFALRNSTIEVPIDKASSSLTNVVNPEDEKKENSATDQTQGSGESSVADQQLAQGNSGASNSAGNSSSSTSPAYSQNQPTTRSSNRTARSDNRQPETQRQEDQIADDHHQLTQQSREVKNAAGELNGDRHALTNPVNKDQSEEHDGDAMDVTSQGSLAKEAERTDSAKGNNTLVDNSPKLAERNAAATVADSAELQIADNRIPPQQSAKEKEMPEEPKTRVPRKISLYFIAMPTLGYQRIEANQADNVFVESISKVSNFSTKRLGIRAELGAEYSLSKRIKVFGGLLYYQRKQTIDYVERVVSNDVVESPTDSDSVFTVEPEFASEQRTFEYELKNIGVQLGINYVIREGKFLHTAGTGIEFHKGLNKLSEAQRNLGFGSSPSTYVFYNFYYRIQYPAQGRLRAVFQPTFNYSLYLDKDMNAPFYVKPYGLGLNLGVTYHF